MNATTPLHPLYGVFDTRQSGAVRLVAKFVDPAPARAAAALLAFAGDNVHVELLTGDDNDTSIAGQAQRGGA